MKFYHLHLHSHYSLLDGLPKIDEILEMAKKMGMDAVALTDHGVMYGAIEFYSKAKEQGIKPIIGEEFYLAYETIDKRRPKIDDKRYHIVLLAKNFKGYQNLVKLTTKAWLEGFYYKPRIDENLLEEYSEGLICLSACLQGKIPQLLLQRRFDDALKLSQKYQSIFGKDNFFLELQYHPNIKEQEIANKGLIEISRRLKIPIVATNDCHYLKKEDAKAQDILMLINTQAKPDDPERLTMISDDFSFRSPEEMIKAFKDFPQAIENTEKIKEMIDLEIPLGKYTLPHFSLPSGETPESFLKKIAYEGAKKRFGKIPDEVKKRLDYELSVVEKTGFATYFLIAQDLVLQAKKRGILVGPGRGSVGGSLLAYCLFITEVNPLKYGLLFERFLNPERISPPDIDIDFEDKRRDEVIEYARQKYGKENVAQIITFGTMAARQVVRDVGRALRYPYSFCDKIAKLIPFNFTLKETLEKIVEFKNLYLSKKEVKKLIDISLKLEGVVRHASTHACGVVISPFPLVDLIPLQFASQNDRTIITQYDMYSIDKLGLLKMDILGLKNLTLIKEAQRLVKKLKGIEINLEKIPFDDKATLDLLSRGETTGVFQLESEGMKNALHEFKVRSFEDLILILAVYRPGPMELIPEMVKRRWKLKKTEYLHPKLEPILKETYGFPVYQEQIMKIAQSLAGFSLGEADILRKAIGKKQKELLYSMKEKFIQGCKKNGISEEISTKIWHWIEPFASYSFNKSHATCYAFIAFITAYLKAHFPMEFMTTLLNAEHKNLDRLKILLKECERQGIKVLPPDINESLSGFTIVGTRNIRFGLSAIKNVGEKVSEMIVNERKKNGPFKNLLDFFERVPEEVLNKKTIESLAKAGVFDKLEKREKILHNLEKLLEIGRSAHKRKKANQAFLFSNPGTFFSFNLENPKEKIDSFQKILWEKELLGVFVSSHPLDKVAESEKKYALPISEIKSSFVKTRIKIVGVVTKIEKRSARNGRPLLFLEVEDKSGKIETIVFEEVFSRSPEIFQENKILRISGEVTEKDGIPKIVAQDVKEVK